MRCEETHPIPDEHNICRACEEIDVSKPFWDGQRCVSSEEAPEGYVWDGQSYIRSPFCGSWSIANVDETECMGKCANGRPIVAENDIGNYYRCRPETWCA